MKIAILNYYQNGVARGLETFVRELSINLSKKGHQILVPPSPLKAEANSSKLNAIRRLFLDSQSLKVLACTVKVLSQLQVFKPNIILATNGGWQALVLRIYCHLVDIKLVIPGQSGPGWDDRWNLLVKPDLFVALTQSQLEWAKKATIWKQKFSLIPNGVDLNQFKPVGPHMNMKLKKPVILCVGASSPSKRIDSTIRAVAELPQSSLILVGKGPLDASINNLGEKLLGKRFLHLSITHDQMPQLYRSADLFTLCSDSSEAFGIVYLEAMASGLGVVATDDASRREIIGKAGLFVKHPEDPLDYVTVIKDALSRKWTKESLFQAKKFSWEKIAFQYEEEMVKI